MSDAPESPEAAETAGSGSADAGGETATTGEAAADDAGGAVDPDDVTGGAAGDADSTGDEPRAGTITAAVVTVASEGTIEDDAAGAAVRDALEAAGHEVATRNLVRDDYDGVQSEVATLVKRDDVEAVVTTGCTGVAPNHVTIEAVEPLLDKELPGFGEAYRRRSGERLGSRVVSTRALAGVADGVPIFCLPDGEAAARMGTEELVAPEVAAIASEAQPEDEDDDAAGTAQR